MACENYLPVFQDQIPPHLNGMRADPMGGLNCTCYSAGMAADLHTCGRTKPSGKIIRELTRDTSGGTNLSQTDAALRTGYGIDLDTRYRLSWMDFVREIHAGRGAILQLLYAPIRESRFRGSEVFAGNHAIFIAPAKAGQSPALIGMDPLADGRRPGLYRYRQESYPTGLLREAAGGLLLGPGRRLGEGWVYCSFTQDQRPRMYRVAFTPGPFTVYQRVKVDGRWTFRALRKARKFPRNTAALCGRPRRYPLSGRPTVTRSCVPMQSGSLKGLWVAVPQVHATLRVFP